ncbi:MAG: deferrochelatase/peroxidase EfeB, partial [Solirubrobacteraceae bacterium]|nr:deferrochelatase/peroxidase EfeB [Solirubrobacteraceae bacterium]
KGLQNLSRQARNLSTGYSVGTADPDEPPQDSGTLGTTIAPDQLVTTIAFGHSLFGARYGLAASKPDGLKPMPRFPDDDLDDTRTHGDVLVTLAATQRDTVVHAMRELLRETRDTFAVRWTLDGFSSADRGPTPRAARRNLFGFRDGTSNPPADARVWRPDGGTFQVVRTIRMQVEFWDRVGMREQETMIGRTRDTGAPLGGSDEFQSPRFDLDPEGDRIALDAHIRLANPRTPATEAQRFVRRSFNYHRGVDRAGQLDQGLIFVAYNADIERQFEAVQKRLAGEPLTDYITPVGGGYFFAPRGSRGPTDWVGSSLL